MFAYVLKRLLLMVPTTFGISLILWVIMVAAPGRPGPGGQEFQSDKGTAGDPAKEVAKGESQANFRRQFALDRPVFFNGWTDLSRDEVRDAVTTQRMSVADIGAGTKRKAQEKLEDWGTYAVPALVSLLEESASDPVLQDSVLSWLRRNASQRMIPTDDPVEMEKNRAAGLENAEIQTLGWPADADASTRAAVVARWRAWFEARKSRWTWSGLEAARIGFTDTQFGTYWGNLAKFDLGRSHMHKRPVVDLILERLPVTMLLSFASILLVYVLAVPLGIYGSVRAGQLSDRSISVGLFLLYSLPSFFVGTVLLRLVTIGQPFKWFPTGGFQDAAAVGWNTWDRLRDVLWHITLPLVTMTYGGLAGLSRFARTGMLDVLRADYVRTARAKGLSESNVIFRHAARNGMMPVVTLLGGLLPGLVGGSVVVEYIFNIQGIGLLTIEAINNRDYNIVVGETLFVAILTQVGILMSDLLYAVMDPRISYS